MRRRTAIRVRLTLWYGGLFLLGGSVLLGLNFLLVYRDFPSGGEELRQAVAKRLQVSPDEFAAREPAIGQSSASATTAASQGPFPGNSGPPPPTGSSPITFPTLFDQITAELKVNTLQQLVLQSSIAMLIMAVLSMAMGWFMAGRMLRPLHAITSTVHSISQDNLEGRVALDGPSDELKALADQFDAMLDRLQQAFEAQQEFVANASHELRTPLTIIRTEVEVTLSDHDVSREELEHMGGVVRRAIERTEMLIDRLIMLAYAGEPLHRNEPVDLADIAREVASARSIQIGEKELRCVVDYSKAETTGDPLLLDSLITNLLDNAIRHNVRGGLLAVSTDTRGDQAIVTVTNDGPYVPPERVSQLFERFTRLDRSRSRETGGYGLGLAIVRAIARRHGGEVRAMARAEGGLTLEACFPRASDTDRVS